MKTRRRGETDLPILLIIVVVAGKAGKTGPGQTKPRLGTTGKPAKPKQASSLDFPSSVLRASATGRFSVSRTDILGTDVDVQK